MKKIRKAVITAGGLGTRMLPVAKAVPKEMLPIVDKPALHYLVEEAVKSGITDILIITARDKGGIEDYFDYSPEYEDRLSRKPGSEKTLKELRNTADMANIYYIRQKEARGLGHAVLKAKSFIGNDDFIVIYGDDVIISEEPVCRQLIDTYERFGGEAAVCGVSEVSPELISKYCSLKVSPAGSDKEFYVSDMIEKPDSPEKIFSNYSILGRVLLTPAIFDILERQPEGFGGEIQLTDAMKTFITENGEKNKMIARVFDGVRHDIGSKLGFLTANVIEGIKHPEVGEEFKKFLKEFARTL